MKCSFSHHARHLFVRAVVMASLMMPYAAHAQLFGERPPPVPPAAVPGGDGAAMNLAPPSGPAAIPGGTLTAPSPSLTAPTSAPTSLPTTPAGQGVLVLNARFGKDMPAIGGGTQWRIYADKPDASGALRLIREEKSATPNVILPQGNYVVHCAVGLVSTARAVTVGQDTTRETFELPAGGLRIEGRVGTSRIPPGQITFDIYKGSQFETTERAPLAQRVAAGDVAVVPEGTYYIVSNYGDANSVVRSDIRVQTGKLTDVTVQHRAAVITLKLVSDKGGDALANTTWTVITPGGDVIKEATGAFPSVVLAEGDYRAIARNEGRVFEHEFKVTTGVDGEVEVSARAPSARVR